MSTEWASPIDAFELFWGEWKETAASYTDEGCATPSLKNMVSAASDLGASGKAA